MLNKYLVVVKEEFVRDAQVANNVNADPMDTNWNDIQGEIVLSQHDAPDKETAIKFAAALRSDIPVELLDAYQLN